MTKCIVYKSCKHVPRGKTMNKCTPSYTFPESSRNWTLCNMSNWGKYYKKYKKFCKSQQNCTMKKTNITKNTVNAKVLHKKMPYIWRFLKPQTRKAMIKLANKPLSEINIPFHIYPGKTLKYDKFLKRMDPKNKKLFRKLRKTYKNI